MSESTVMKACLATIGVVLVGLLAIPVFARFIMAMLALAMLLAAVIVVIWALTRRGSSAVHSAPPRGYPGYGSHVVGPYQPNTYCVYPEMYAMPTTAVPAPYWPPSPPPEPLPLPPAEDVVIEQPEPAPPLSVQQRRQASAITRRILMHGEGSR